MLDVGVYLWPGLGIGVNRLCVLFVCIVYTHTICINTHVYIQYAETCVFVCVFVYIMHLSNLQENLGCLPIQTPVSFLCYIHNRATYCVFTQRFLHCTHGANGLCSQNCIGNLLGCVCFSPPLPFSVGITARTGLFVSLAYHRGRSMAVMLRAWLSPLCCISQK